MELLNIVLCSCKLLVDTYCCKTYIYWTLCMFYIKCFDSYLLKPTLWTTLHVNAFEIQVFMGRTLSIFYVETCFCMNVLFMFWLNIFERRSSATVANTTSYVFNHLFKFYQLVSISSNLYSDELPWNSFPYWKRKEIALELCAFGIRTILGQDGMDAAEMYDVTSVFVPFWVKMVRMQLKCMMLLLNSSIGFRLHVRLYILLNQASSWYSYQWDFISYTLYSIDFHFHTCILQATYLTSMVNNQRFEFE